MATWKELGEVPDSEDEGGWDSSQESLHDLPSPPRISQDAPDDAQDARYTDAPATSVEGATIWDVPRSSQSLHEASDVVQSPKRPDSTLLTYTPPALLGSPPPPPSVESLSDIDITENLDDDNTLTLPDFEATIPPPTVEPPTVDEHQDPLSQSDMPAPPARVNFEVQISSAALCNTQFEAEDFQRGRSFRPRKPIQEHPYLLENVQYSKTLKSHGLRPVRMQIEEEKRRRQEEDSQEQDYEDDSQPTDKNTGNVETEESQGPGPLDPESDINLQGLSDDGEPSQSPEHRPPRIIEDLSNSEDDDDELPDTADIEKWRKAGQKTRKRRPSATAIPKKKKLAKYTNSSRPMDVTLNLPRVEDIFDIPASPPQTSPAALIATPMAVLNRMGSASVAVLTPKPSSDFSSRMNSPAPANTHHDLVDLTNVENEDDSDRQLSENSGSESDEHIRRIAKRMRKVLPASWARLDLQSSTRKTKPAPREQSQGPSPKKTPRRGVAQRRVLSPRPGLGNALFLDDDSNESDTPTRLDDPDQSPQDLPFSHFEDDAMSVVEEDHIDQMLPGAKRRSTGTSGLPRKRRKGKRPILQGHPVQQIRQQRITGLLGRAQSGVSQDQPKRPPKTKAPAGGMNKRSAQRKPRTPPPPRLSIVDVLEPNAPAFIRIAARTAGKRRDLGRSSPTNKTILLATRGDTIEAGKILGNWRGGSIRPRDSSALTARPRPRQTTLATTKPSDPQVRRAKPAKKQRSRFGASRFSQPRRFVKQTSMDDFVATGMHSQGVQDVQDVEPHIPLTRPKKADQASIRPAQLEMDGDVPNRQAFGRRKKALDALYRRSRHQLSPPPNVRLEQFVETTTENTQPAGAVPALLPDNDTPTRRLVSGRKLRRKQFRPQNVDVSAPQFSHANDPLPHQFDPVIVENIDFAHAKHDGKLLGLAPFGTHYTQHFEVFPLDHGVFFHQSTLLGSSRLSNVLSSEYRRDLSRSRDQCTFVLGEQMLHWGIWNAQVSSDLGIVSDWMVDKLEASNSYSSEGTITVQAADFILTYLQDHISFSELDSTSTGFFASRVIEVMESFERRIKDLACNSVSRNQYIVEVLTRVLLCTAQTWRICQNLNALSEAFKLEELLKRLASVLAEKLVGIGFADIRVIYGRLQQISIREKGLGNEQFVMIGWVTLIRTLQGLGLPRAGFWDVVSSTILRSSAECISDAAVLEQTWWNVFTLLPLGDFDSNGVATPGNRHTAPLEGWTLPQRLLRRVFQLYQNNHRQAPGFNDYVRALVGRCHYLVAQWGWRKSNSILGMIFDFFAAQDLHNLRNEEAYQSPLFLEQLSGQPSLAITLDDRCFHIFLKLVALSITRLRKHAQSKEVRNIVARLLPNHNRQYEKVMATHETEIAALRNHHDLLCTLFWAAPPEMRPSVQSIEDLVVLGSSHKEACLINVRAWSRLSRFIVSTSADITLYQPFANWQKNIFRQVLEQYLSVEMEVKQQLQGMSAEACRNITEEQRNDVINRNKKVALDILHYSMKAFLEVLRETRTTDAASFVLNHYPFEDIATRLSFSSANSDWGILQVFLEIIDCYLERIHETATHESQEDYLRQEEDAIMLLERKLAAPVMSLVHDLVHIPTQAFAARDHILRVEQAVVVAGKLATKLVSAQLTKPRQFFQSGKYRIFQGVSKPIASPSRKFVCLFLATMLGAGVPALEDFQMTSLDFLLSELVKPSEYLAYEYILAPVMARMGEMHLQNVALEEGKHPDYVSNRKVFNYLLVSMRNEVRRAEPSQKQVLRTKYSKGLRSLMEQLKVDLKSMDFNSSEHLNYVEFVRSIITIIRSQDLCPIDTFFYQISQEYSPSKQDPRLQTAGILSWGIKLEEGDPAAVFGLFYLLFPSFKIALANGELENEKMILSRGMKQVQIFNFMLGTMLPAIIKTITQAPQSWVLLDTYIEAIDERLSKPAIHRQLEGGSLTDLLTLHNVVLNSARELQMKDVFEMKDEDAMVLMLGMKALNVLSSATKAVLFNERASDIAVEIRQTRAEITEFARAADEYLEELCEGDVQFEVLDASRLFKGVRLAKPSAGEQVERFMKHMVKDIQENWVFTEERATVKAPGRPQATQGVGSKAKRWDKQELVWGLWEQVKRWGDANDVMMRKKEHGRRVGALMDELGLF
ncbi:hypothetical protein GGR57DRAFT_463580 [Xylariaceae sp. FL1272]|nr:hypothetical protein GGR57DRAFT_463580 [Xylariaceae sp. FL1272]